MRDPRGQELVKAATHLARADFPIIHEKLNWETGYRRRRMAIDLAPYHAKKYDTLFMARKFPDQKSGLKN
jgi:hypothetical protein